jgi:hypothetical protein
VQLPWLQLNGQAVVGGGVAIDGAIGSDVKPVVAAGRASAAIPTSMSADNDVQAIHLNLAGGVCIDGGVAPDAAVSSVVRPVQVGGVASTAEPTAMSADNDVVRGWFSRNGALNVVDRKAMLTATATPTITAGAYSALDAVGGVMTFAVATASGRGFRIVNATILDEADQAALLHLWLFKVTPTSPAADNDAFAISDANILTAIPIGVIDFLAANYRDANTSMVGMGTCRGLAPNIQAATSGSVNIFGQLQTGTAATPTYAATDDLTVWLEVEAY